MLLFRLFGKYAEEICFRHPVRIVLERVKNADGQSDASRVTEPRCYTSFLPVIIKVGG
jgi:hypothetical protein